MDPTYITPNRRAKRGAAIPEFPACSHNHKAEQAIANLSEAEKEAACLTFRNKVCQVANHGLWCKHPLLNTTRCSSLLGFCTYYSMFELHVVCGTIFVLQKFFSSPS